MFPQPNGPAVLRLFFSSEDQAPCYHITDIFKTRSCVPTFVGTWGLILNKILEMWDHRPSPLTENVWSQCCTAVLKSVLLVFTWLKDYQKPKGQTYCKAKPCKFPPFSGCLDLRCSHAVCSVLLQVDKVTGRFNGQFKTYAICGAIRRMVSLSSSGRCSAPSQPSLKHRTLSVIRKRVLGEHYQRP